MTGLPPFPVDAGTLALLEHALDPWRNGDPKAARTSLGEFLDLMSRMGGSDPSVFVEERRAFAEFGDSYAGELRDPMYSHGDVILALVAEVKRLREVAGDGAA